MKKKRGYWILALAFFVGLSLLLYPTISEKWNSHYNTGLIVNYENEVAQMDDSQFDEMLSAAADYNSNIPNRSNVFVLSEEEEKLYKTLLSLETSDVIAHIEIPELEVTLPIYHGTDEEILQSGIGHIDWSSLPVGGEGTHCLLSGHRGLPSSKLFTDLDEMAVGDLFMIYVLDETLTYEVDQILIVEPDDVSALQIVPGEDYCTLVTCTPYGINTQRLLVRGHRVENLEETEKIYVSSDAVQIEPLLVAPVLLVPLLIAVLLWIAISDIKKRRKSR